MKSSKLVLLVLSFVIAVALSACSSTPKTDTNTAGTATPAQTPAADTAALSGSILAVGSTALQPLVEQVSKKFMADAKYTKITVQVQGGGSGTGLTQVAGGQAQIGNSDIFAEEKFTGADADKAKGLVDHQVAVVAIAAVTHPDAGVASLTKQQLVDIFTGKTTNWSQVGGKDQKIVLVNRPASSGTRKTFEKYALGTKSQDIAGSIQEDASGTVRKLVGSTPGAIGYLALSYIDGTVKALKYNDVDTTIDNITTGKYPVWAYEHMYTKGEATAVEKAFLDYMVSDAIQSDDVAKLGYISIAKMQVKRDASGAISK